MDSTTEAKLLARLKDLPWFSENCLKVKLKHGNSDGSISFLKFNRAQNYIHQRLEDQLNAMGKVRALILKGRQQGCSTYVQARYFNKIITCRGKKAFVLAHESDATDNLFKMTRRFYDNLEEGLCPEPTKLNMSEMEFALFNSEYRVGTAGNKKTGRSQTIQLFHGSEVGYWENTDDLSTGVFQAISDSPGTEIILESTANGIGNFFHSKWLEAQGGKSEYQAIFVPWYWQDEYRNFTAGFELNEEEHKLMEWYGHDGLTKEHLCWRRFKISGLNKDEERAQELFKQEYPFTSSEAFLNPISDTFIKAKWVNKARKCKVETEIGLIIGVDPASDKDGSDRTAIIKRRGRKAYDLMTYRYHDTMAICGILVNMIKTEKPVKIYIDVIGIGKGIVDRMREMGYDFVEGINVALQAHNKERFANRRAELWNECADWLMQEMEVEIPDSDELQTDLCGCGYRHRSNGQLLIEDKESLKKRGLPSPDTADALIHTFAGGFYESVLNKDVMVNQVPYSSRGMFT